MSEVIDILARFKTKKILVSLDKTGANLSLKGDVKSLSDDDKKELVKNKSLIIDFFNQHKKQDQEIPRTILKEKEYPLSPSQKSIWVHDQINDNMDAYIIPGIYQFHLPQFCFETFTKAVAKLVESNEVLQYVFKLKDSSPYQTTSDFNLKSHLFIKDFRSDLALRKKVSEVIDNSLTKSFDLKSKPPWEIFVFPLEKDQYQFYLKVHHLIADGESLEIIIGKLFEFYQAISQEKPLIDTNSFQFKEYVNWINNKESFGAIGNFWKKQFKGYVETFSLPIERDLSEGESYVKIKCSLGSEINQYARRLRINVTTLYSLAFGVVLSKRSRCDDFVLGIPSASRTSPQLKEVIGDFVNTIPLRLQLDYQLTVEKSLKILQDQYYSILEHQIYPLEYILEDIGYSNKNGSYPLFNVMLSFPNNQNVTEDLFDINKKSSMYDLTCTVLDNEENSMFHFEYDPMKMTNETVSSIGEEMLVVLQQLVNGLNLKLSEIKLVSSKEEQFILQNYSGVQHIVERCNDTVVHHFQKNAQLTPNVTAIIDDNKAYTYRESFRRIENIAEHLKASGVEPGDRVIVELEKSSEQVLVMWAVWMTGAVFVPLDINFPEERRRSVIKGCNPSLIVNIELIKSFSDTSMQYSGDYPQRDDIAYILYTSGSTGKPKGVVLTHSNLNNKLLDEVNLLSLDQSMVAYCLTNNVFDVSFLENVLPFIVGGRTVTPPENIIKDIHSTIRDVIDNEVTILQGTPTYFSHFINEMRKEDAVEINQRLNTICVGGESLGSGLVNKLKEYFPKVKLNNHYGPTEITIDAIVNRNIYSFDNNIIGVPFGSVGAYILDEFDNVLPVNIPGELVITGESVAKGYWNNEYLTEKVFKKLSHSSKRGYWTGDLVSWTNEGQIKFIKRKDEQVKFKGYRIEPEEISQTILSLNKSITDLFISTVNEDLVCWIVSEELDIDSLQNQLLLYLPFYMIPTQFVRVEELERNENGKVNSKKIKEVFQSQLKNRKKRKLNIHDDIGSQLIADVLRMEDIHLEDRFYELGGNSLKAIKLNHVFNEELNIELGIQFLLLNPTIEEILQKKSTKSFHFEKEEIKGGNNNDKPGPAQMSIWKSVHERPESNISFNMVFGVEFPDLLPYQEMEKVYSELMRIHKELRTVFSIEDDVLKRLVTLEKGNLKTFQSETDPIRNKKLVQERVNKLQKSAFELVNNLLFEMHVGLVGDQVNCIIIKTHHLLLDGWSVNLVTQKIVQLIESVHLKQPIVLGDQFSYDDYVVENSFSSVKYPQKMIFWKDYLSKANFETEYKVPIKRSQQKAYKGINQAISWSSEVSLGIEKVSRKEGVPLFSLFLYAVYQGLLEITASDDLIISTPLLGRDDPKVINTIGLMSRLVPLRINLQQGNLIDHLHEVNQNVASVYNNQEIPLIELIDEIGWENNRNRNRYFDFNFAWQSVLNDHENEQENSMQMITPEEIFAKHDIAFAGIKEDGEYKLIMVSELGLIDQKYLDQLKNKIQTTIELIVITYE